MRHNENLKPFVILAFNTDNSDKEKQYLIDRGFKFKDLIGHYNDQIEDSYLVLFNDINELNDLMLIAQKHNQESILIVDSERNASLYYLQTDKRQPIGKFKNVSKQEAYQHEAWSKDWKAGQYYICK